MVVAALDKSIRRAVLVACTVLVAPGFAHAQSAIAGQVTDGTGAVLQE